MIKVDRTTAARSIKSLKSMDLSKRKKMNRTRKLKAFPDRKRKNVYPFIKRENDYSNTVALEGFSETEAETISNLLQRVRKI